MVERKDSQGYALNPRAIVGSEPKAVTLGSLASDLGTSYLASIDNADWSSLANLNPGELRHDTSYREIGRYEKRMECN
jgi:hypothetical protein